MYEKIIRLEINSQNKQLVELQLESEDIQNTSWRNTKIELIIDLNHMAFKSIENLNASLFYWLKSGAINVSIFINNVAEDNASHLANISFFNSLICKIESCRFIQYLKIIVTQCNIFTGCDFVALTQMPNLRILDFSNFNIQEDDNKHLISIVDLLSNIHERSNIAKILLPPSLKKQALNVEFGCDNQLFAAIKYALSVSTNLIEISPLPIFFGLQDDIQAIMNKKQGGKLEELYYEHDKDYETLQQLKMIRNPTRAIASLLAGTSDKFNNIFKNIENFYPIIDSMAPKYIYWLDKILREKMNNPEHILSCLNTVKLHDNCRDILFKILEGLVSDLISCKFKEIDINDKHLTAFVCVNEPLEKSCIIRTLLKIHLEFNLFEDDFLSKILSNMIEEFVYGGGIESINHLVSSAELEDPSYFLMKLLKELESLNRYKKQDNIHKDERYCRAIINKEQSEEQFNLLIAFSNIKIASYETSMARIMGRSRDSSMLESGGEQFDFSSYEEVKVNKLKL